MNIMQALAKDDPRVVAFEAYRATADYRNTRNWALHEKHVDGSLWAAFVLGWETAQVIEAAKPARRETGSTEGESAVVADDAPITGKSDQEGA